MNCPQARFLLYAHFDRELSRKDAEGLSQHLATCGPCTARADSARGLAKVLRSRLDRAAAPERLRSRLQRVPYLTEPMRPRASSYYVFAATIALLVVPLVTDDRAPVSRPAAQATKQLNVVAPGEAPLALVSKRMTGTFVCVQCETRQEAGYCPIPAHTHVPGFCADNGEIWRLMTRTEPGFEGAELGRSATLEGTAFPQSGYLRANRVGY
ncbi:MAG TPA: zf-HC2 domain-containing protein [Thermoanaerobaculia bacterium]|jgi:anti-sigma factor (TIGR02949 family)|nr:zf-HC2 domain-containing protein [Thermoanaerobaculia bacterium]